MIAFLNIDRQIWADVLGTRACGGFVASLGCLLNSCLWGSYSIEGLCQKKAGSVLVEDKSASVMSWFIQKVLSVAKPISRYIYVGSSMRTSMLKSFRYEVERAKTYGAVEMVLKYVLLRMQDRHDGMSDRRVCYAIEHLELQRAAAEQIKNTALKKILFFVKKVDYYDIKEDRVARDNLLNKLREPSIRYVGIAVNAINKELILMIDRASKQLSKNESRDIACSCDMAKEIVNDTSRIIHRMDKHRYRVILDLRSARSFSFSAGLRKSLKTLTAEKIIFNAQNMYKYNVLLAVNRCGPNTKVLKQGIVFNIKSILIGSRFYYKINHIRLVPRFIKVVR